MSDQIDLNAKSMRKRLHICIVVALLLISSITAFLFFPPLPTSNTDNSSSVEFFANRFESKEALTKEPKAFSQSIESLTAEKVVGEPQKSHEIEDGTARLGPWRERVRKEYPELAEALDLSSAQFEELSNILAMQLLDAYENHPLVGPGELEWDEYDKPDWVLEMEARQARWEMEIAAYLGEAKYNDWKTYLNSSTARRIVRTLEARLDGTPDFLRKEQVEPLVAALTERRERYMSNSESFSETNPIDRFAARNERLKQGAIGYLSPSQMAEFSKMLNEQLGQLRTRQSQ